MDWDKYVKSSERDVTGEWRGGLKLIEKILLHENENKNYLHSKSRIDYLLLVTMEGKGGWRWRKYGGWSVYWGYNSGR